MTAEPNAVWDVPRHGSAWVFTAGEHLTKPVVLVGDAGTGLAELAGSADHAAYSLLSELHARGYDLVLFGLPDDSTMTGAGGAVQNVVTRALAEQYGSAPLTVGGTGQGALAARYALASMERMAIDHRSGVHFSHNGAAPGLEDEAELSRAGGRPLIPRFLRLVDGGVDDGLGEEIADDTITGGAGEAGPLLSEEYGSWLVENLAR
ncbi:hypothetical protein [Streptomyces tanashiensis]|uniref:Alpha/beta hydrolase n=1 Tax=Streptomyces tanashiensis TaxID=67367 RepID=A0ABY6R402_9ACTN|nr:hypothetical protein [Streptomyces tanashiensis]UZX23607.1 hypothetical protein LDH80_24090 [Streptomyces tanashiensis]